MNKENKEKVKSNVCPICKRPTHKESKYCIFHASAEEKTEDEFIVALKEYANNIKKEDKDCNFERFIFIGDIDFSEDLSITIFKDTNFFGAIFEGGNNFKNTIFKGYVNFGSSTFKEYTNFSGAIFGANAGFIGATFEGEAIFISTIFEGGASFISATFKRGTNFTSVAFKGYADFRDVTFEEKTNFFSATFKGYANFSGSTFEGDMNFEAKSFVGSVSFSEVNLSLRKKLSLKVENNKVNVSFEHAYLQNTYLYIDLAKDVLIDFTNAFLNNTKIEKYQIENHIFQEKKKKFSKAQQVYFLLKNNFHSIGRYDDESWAFKKEKDMERKRYYHFRSLHKWLWSCFLNSIYGYGEKPERVIVSAITIIIIFAFVFMNFGIDANPQLDTIPKCNILEKLFIGVRYGDLLIRLKDVSWEQIKNCLYFSTVTFTTLGYGDFRPLEGWSRIFAGTEAFIGALMMALFVYTFARRTGGR